MSGRRSPGLYLKLFEYLSLTALTLISLAFYLTRGRLYLYALLCFIFIAAFSLFTFEHTSQQDLLVTGTGLIFYAFGLLILQIMLKRSVSLQLLSRIAASDRRNLMFNPEIKGRFHDMGKFGLTTMDQTGSYCLSSFGWFIATLTNICYYVLRINR